MRSRPAFLAALSVCLLPAVVAAQLSPGPLSQAHHQLEGLKNCTRCHEFGRQLDADRCLTCHEVLAGRIAAGQGLHARRDHRHCALCHTEHHGRKFALVHWPDGETAFDHRTAGYPLIGRHATTPCRRCHRGANLSPEIRTRLTAEERNLNDTFLGLDTSCSSCHEDVHRAQFVNDCADCHTPADWRPATEFDHANSRYPLTGRHREVTCEKCHPAATVDGEPHVRYSGIRFASCADCHDDPHAGRLGSRCADCHTADGWRNVPSTSFSHETTRFPLRGRHAGLACDTCHQPSEPRAPLPFASCNDCHTDFHGQADPAGIYGQCDTCHDLAGFSPSTFTVARHDSSSFPLDGAHLAVPCFVCHQTRTATGAEAVKLQVPGQICASCHDDPHRGELVELVRAEGCEVCHSTSNWSTVFFDHQRTRFPLTDGHATVACRRCHRGRVVADGTTGLRFRFMSMACEDCHTDPHRGQFRDATLADQTGTRGTACERCHSAGSWLPNRFDHDRDSRFPLTGGHRLVACSGCHPSLEADGSPFFQYRPLTTACDGCHQARQTGTAEDNKP